jgi:uncharacterized protein (DUF1697 family)
VWLPAMTRPSLPRCAALLRAVNVGGRKVAMAPLRDALRADGLEDVETLLASGNVVTRQPLSGPDELAVRIETVVERTFGLRSAVVVRTHDALARASAEHPFAGDEENLSFLHVVFLRDEPDAQRIATMDFDRSPPDRFRVAGREIYLHYPEGSGRSKLTLDWLERGLGTIGTARNLNTVLKLVALTDPKRGLWLAMEAPVAGSTRLRHLV